MQSDDNTRQLATLHRGMSQLGLRMNRVLELLDPQGSPGDESSTLPLVLALLDAIESTLAAPVPPATWWHGLLGISTAPDLRGLALARDHALQQLALADIFPTPKEGPVDPRLHQIVETRAAADPPLDGTLSHTHLTGWHRRGDPPQVIRLAHVTAWRATEQA